MKTLDSFSDKLERDIIDLFFYHLIGVNIKQISTTASRRILSYKNKTLGKIEIYMYSYSHDPTPLTIFFNDDPSSIREFKRNDYKAVRCVLDWIHQKKCSMCIVPYTKIK